MKYVKMLGLAAVAAMALMAFGVGTASATELYSTSGTIPVNTTLTAAAEGNTASLASTSEEPIVTCTESSVTGKITSAGSSTTTVKGSVSNLTFTGGCSVTVNQAKNGTLELHHITGTTNGTVTGTGFYVTVHSPFVGECNYGLGTGNVDLGTLTGKTGAKEDATMDINGIVTEQEPKRLLCPDTTRWIANYNVTSPTPLWVEAS